MPPSACCSSDKALISLMEAASTTDDRQTACRCLNLVLQSLNVNIKLAESLSVNCRINLGFTISPSVDCSM
ncbi:hypothetical protein OSB04_013072 [Centaurea solstitialis]|uniref:Non-specific lipid-transfer protein n=1 Tax=Centaurea solstitialis TaxID=347529 RepID=A0AA38TXA3_9ASTR|nr:hypothetical protein OSB04_013072 [Centaurea solstitialis]